ncbi:TraK family protein [Desulfovibrio sp. OttesenSCG-928-C14]|nr:TraK family protein [Desulfovibrio sp. OttesenSCG-928-C14]
MPAHERLRHHKAKIQYRAWKETIFQMMEQGYSKRLIHEELTKDGRISMAYITLCQFIRNSKKQAPACPAPENKSKAPPAASPAQPKIIKANTDTLQDPRTVDTSKFF